MDSWTTPDKAFAIVPIALEDVMQSWDYYLKHLNQGRPFIIAGYSQGAIAVLDILKEMPDSVLSRLVAAYVPESIIYFTENNVACINPVSWRTDEEPTPFVLYGRRRNDTLSVRCDTVSHHLMVEGITKHRPMPVIGKPGNYHNMELKFYYPYVRKNMADRVAAFLAKKKEE